MIIVMIMCASSCVCCHVCVVMYMLSCVCCHGYRAEREVAMQLSTGPLVNLVLNNIENCHKNK